MTSPPQKTFSVVIRISDLDIPNGQMQAGTEGVDSERFKNYFLEKYGHGSGKLDVDFKSNKVKLTWVQPKHNLEAAEIHQQALSYARIKNYKDAIGSWVRAIALNPMDPDYYFNLGIAFFENKNYKEAVENLVNALNLCPIYYKALLILGTVHLKTRKFEDAEKYLKESLPFYPKHPLAYLNLGAVYSILRRYDDGVKMFLKTIELSREEVRAHFGLAKIYSLIGVNDKANQYYKNVIDINKNQQLANLAQRAMVSLNSTPFQEPGEFSAAHSSKPETIDFSNVERYYQEGYTAFLYSDYERAAQMYQKYLEHKPNDDFVWFSFGEASLRANKLQQAADALEKAISINGSKATYHKELAITYNYLGRQDETLQCLAKAEELGKKDSILSTIWGKVLIEQKKYDVAVQKLELAVKLNTNNLLAKYNLAIAAYKSQQKEAAVNQLHEILRATVNSPIKMEAENLLKRL